MKSKKRTLLCPICGRYKIEKIYNAAKHPFFEGVKLQPYKKIFYFPLPIKRCTNCSFVFKKPSAETSRKLDRFYKSQISMSTAAIDKSEHSLRMAKKFIGTLENNIDKNKVKRLLEIGCREGFILAYLRKKYGFEAVGIDVSSVEPYQDDLGPLHIIDDYFPSKKVSGRFDLIYAKGVLEHIEDINLIVLNAWRKLNPGGIFISQVPTVAGSLGAGNIGIFIHEHVNFFSKETLAFLCLKNNFKVKNIIEDNALLTIVCQKIDRVGRKPKPPHIIYEKKYPLVMNTFKENLCEKDVGFFGASQELFSYLYMVLGDTETKFNIYDNDAFKVGKYFGKNKIPIKSAAEISDRKVVIMPYTYADEIEKDLIKKKIKSEIINIWTETKNPKK